MKKPKRIYDPYADMLGEFNRNNIPYVIVGMSGINYYASDARETFATNDFGVFIKPTIGHVTKAVQTLKKLDYMLMVNGMEIGEKTIGNIVRQKKIIVASDPYGIVIEIILAVSGFTFSQMEKDMSIFIVGDIPVKVAQLSKLIASKKIAGRSKDRLFLRRYEMLLREIGDARKGK